ncbi:LPXTG cell wall anchor domain-containing protein [Agrococcus jejuensis]|uniref:LPXTG-motif cell wall anchor domain-containing protein n=1 Tax=Agrococcus jejuensis TaxID=399736 RepID=A0A1G8F2G5_9MICO|nr:LPXTG cell wall anchor domain-containing protein [Agrococcus jejuensis]SDH76346.1 LPXTG-motif cell wall anchor domain-containing protein [Agrococcus jejuensis]
MTTRILRRAVASALALAIGVGGMSLGVAAATAADVTPPADVTVESSQPTPTEAAPAPDAQPAASAAAPAPSEPPAVVEEPSAPVEITAPVALDEPAAAAATDTVDESIATPAASAAQSAPAVAAAQPIATAAVAAPVTVAVTNAGSSTVTALPAYFDVTFSEPVTGFDATDVLVTNLGSPPLGAQFAVEGSGAGYRLRLDSVGRPLRIGTYALSVRAGAAVSAGGVANTASPLVGFTGRIIDTSLQTTVSQTTYAPSTVGAFSVDFGRHVVGFDVDDLTFTGAVVSGVTISGSGRLYHVAIGSIDRPAAVTMEVRAGAVQYAGVSSPAASGTGFIGRTVPTTITLAEGQESPTSDGTVRFVVTFADVVTDFGVDDVELDAPAGAVASVTGSGRTYEVVVDGFQRAGDVAVSVPADRVRGSFGAPNEASNAVTVAFAPARPEIVVARGSQQPATTDVDDAVFDIRSSVPVTGLEVSDLVIGGTAGATTVDLLPVGDDAFIATVSGAVRAGTITLSVLEGAAVGPLETESLASAASDEGVLFAPPAPTVTVEQGFSQADPETFGFITFEVQLSQEVTGLEASDFVVGGTAGASTVSLQGSGSWYTATVFDMVRPGTVTLALPAGAAVSQYGVANLASTSVDATVQFAPPTPTASITLAEGQSGSTAVQPFVFDVSFSVPVSGFDADDVIVLGSGRDIVVEVTPRGGPMLGDAAAAATALDVAAADELLYDFTVRVSGTFDAGSISIAIREGAVVSGFGVANARIEASTDAAIAYVPASVVTPAPVAAAPAATAPGVASTAGAAAQSTLPRTGGEPSWALMLAAALLLALGGVVRRTRTR